MRGSHDGRPLDACLGLVAVASVVALAWLASGELNAAAATAREQTRRGVVVGAVHAERIADDIAGARPVRRADRRVYRYSVVPGGVYSGAEARRRVARDAAVASHYADLDVDQLRAERLAAPARVFVSYRKNGVVYWTRHAVAVPAGERVLSDGTHLIRARCGNRLSPIPMTPVSDDEPVPGALDEIDLADEAVLASMPLDVGYAGADVMPTGLPVADTGTTVAPDIDPLGDMRGGHAGVAGNRTPGAPDDPGDPADADDPGDPSDPTTRRTRTRTVPEPTTMMLFGTAVAMAAWRARSR